jgi:hypothetical protein
MLDMKQRRTAATQNMCSAVTVRARGRLPSDVLSELRDALADAPPVVSCDLTGLATVRAGFGDELAELASFVDNWPGTALVLCVPHPKLREELVAADLGGRVRVHDRWAACVHDQVHAKMPQALRRSTQLPPLPIAPQLARQFVATTLRGWQLMSRVEAATLVTSELVTDAVVRAATVLDLTLAEANGSLLVSVRDRGRGWPPSYPEEAAGARADHWRQILTACTRAWGVMPARSSGKTVWAALAPA